MVISTAIPILCVISKVSILIIFVKEKTLFRRSPRIGRLAAKRRVLPFVLFRSWSMDVEVKPLQFSQNRKLTVANYYLHSKHVNL